MTTPPSGISEADWLATAARVRALVMAQQEQIQLLQQQLTALTTELASQLDDSLHPDHTTAHGVADAAVLHFVDLLRGGNGAGEGHGLKEEQSSPSENDYRSSPNRFLRLAHGKREPSSCRPRDKPAAPTTGASAAAISAGSARGKAGTERPGASPAAAVRAGAAGPGAQPQAGQRRERVCPAGTDQHHLICVQCGSSEPLPICPLAGRGLGLTKVLLEGFQPLFHTFELHGICARCQQIQAAGHG
jgi:hypothetical protein